VDRSREKGIGRREAAFTLKRGTGEFEDALIGALNA